MVDPRSLVRVHDLFEDFHRTWRTPKGGSPGWRIEGQELVVVPGAGDVLTRARFGDFQLHLEFWLPYLPDAHGQDRANSGVYLQGRYELQLLDSYGQPPALDSCGAVYKLAPPLHTPLLPPEQWQSLDVAFKTATRSEPARVTVSLNGIVVHNHLALPGPTPGALDEDVLSPGPLLLQDHGARVRFRNAFVVGEARDS